MNLGQFHASLIPVSQVEAAAAAQRHVLRAVAGEWEARQNQASTFKTSVSCLLIFHGAKGVTWLKPISVGLGYTPQRGWSEKLKRGE